MEKEIFWKLLLSYLLLLIISAGILSIFKLSYLTFLLILVIVTVIATVISAEYVRHIDEISNAIFDISRGKFGGFVSRRSTNEFRRLEDAVSELQGKLVSTLGALSDSQNKIRAILSSMVEGVVAIDRSDNVILINANAQSLLGIREDDVIGKNYIERIRNPELIEALRAAKANEMNGERQITIYGPDERTILAQAASTKEGGAVVVLHDITKIKMLEKMRSEFVANVSHELKTPLTSIKASVDTLLGGAIKDVEHNVNFLNRINSNSDRLSALIDDILELSDLENKRAPQALVTCDLNDLVNRAVDVVLPKAKIRNISILNKLQGGNIRGLCDEDHISRVLLNLLDNAVKYNKDNGSVTVSSSEEGPMIQIDVSDTGIGIEEKHFPRLFERFYTVDKARSREMGGTGLGLSIAKHIVELHGGKIWVTSFPGKGSTFSFTLKKAS